MLWKIEGSAVDVQRSNTSEDSVEILGGYVPAMKCPLDQYGLKVPPSKAMLSGEAPVEL